MPRIYLETTMFNYYFDTDRDAHADTVMLFEECAAGRFEPFTSNHVIDELNDAEAAKCDKMIALIAKYSITVLASNAESERLAARYIAEGALPKGSVADASHIYSRRVGVRARQNRQLELSAYRPRKDDRYDYGNKYAAQIQSDKD